MIFALLEPKNCEVIENSSKAPLNKMHIFAKKLFQYHKR